MKALLFYLLCAAELIVASYTREFNASPGSILQIRDTAYLVARADNRNGDKNRSPQRDASPRASVSVVGPAKLFANGPGHKITYVPHNQVRIATSRHPKNPYADGRLLGPAEQGASGRSRDGHPMKAIAQGKAATAQVTVPHGEHGTLRVKNSVEDQSIQIQGPDAKKLHIQSNHPGGAKAFASVTRPGAVNVDAEK